MGPWGPLPSQDRLIGKYRVDVRLPQKNKAKGKRVAHACNSSPQEAEAAS